MNMNIKALLLDADGVVIKKHKYFSARLKEEFGKVIPKDSEIKFFAREYKLCAVGKADLKKELSK